MRLLPWHRAMELSGAPDADRGRGCVYVATDGRLVKIGTSLAPSRRVAHLNSPGEREKARAKRVFAGVLRLVFATEGGSERESSLHRAFAQEEVASEWFTGGTVMAFVIDSVLESTECALEEIDSNSVEENRLGAARGSVGERVRAARKRHGIGQRKLSQLVGVSPAYVSQLENTGPGARICTPSTEKLVAFAEKLNVSFDWLAFGGSAPEWMKTQ